MCTKIRYVCVFNPKISILAIYYTYFALVDNHLIL